MQVQLEGQVALVTGAANGIGRRDDGEFVTMPFGDLTVSEGKLLRWVREVGDAVKAGEHVADIEADKAVVEIKAPRAGVIGERLAEAGATVKMGAPIGVVR